MTKSITPKSPPPKSKSLAKPIRLSAFARRLLMAWRSLELPLSNSVIVAVSGGADSAALLAGLDELIKSKKLDVRLIVAHLNHKLRGSGTDGLAGMEPVRKMDSKSNLIIARPLLTWAKRSDTESYCRARGIDFRVDEMNADEAFARVRVRTQLLPLLKTFNPKAEEAISRAAEILREDNSALDAAAGRLLEYSAATP